MNGMNDVLFDVWCLSVTLIFVAQFFTLPSVLNIFFKKRISASLLRFFRFGSIIASVRLIFNSALFFPRFFEQLVVFLQVY